MEIRNKNLMKEFKELADLNIKAREVKEKLIENVKETLKEYDFEEQIEMIIVNDLQYLNLYFKKNTNLDKALIDICLEEFNCYKYAVQNPIDGQTIELRLYFNIQNILEELKE